MCCSDQLNPPPKLPVTSVSEVAERTCYSDGLGSLTQLDLGKFAKQSQKRWQPSSYSPMWLLTAYGEPASHSGRLNTSSCNTTRIDVFAVPSEKMLCDLSWSEEPGLERRPASLPPCRGASTGRWQVFRILRHSFSNFGTTAL